MEGAALTSTMTSASRHYFSTASFVPLSRFVEKMHAYKAQLYVLYVTEGSSLLSATRIPPLYVSLFNQRGLGEAKIWSIV
jgi:hypothetical protein